MVLLNPDCGFLSPPIKKKKNIPTLEITSDHPACEMCGGPNGLSWFEGEGSRKAPNPRCRGQVLPPFPGPLGPTAKDSGRRRLQSGALCDSAIREQGLGWIRAGPTPIPLSLSLPLTTPTSLPFTTERRHARHTLCLSSVPNSQNSAKKTKHWHETSASPFAFTPWAQKARASVHKSKGVSVCEEVDTHPQAGSFLVSLSS